MTDLREKIVEIFCEWNEDETAESVADRILALLPKVLGLRWDGRVLRIGSIAVGRVGEEDDGRYYGNWLHDEDGYFTDDVNDDIFAATEAEARAAVEAAVRKALGWEA